MPDGRWKRRPEGANWGDFGSDDRLGTLNHITPETVRAAADEIRHGRVFCLSLPLTLPGGNILNPRRHPPKLRPTMRGEQPNYNYAPEPEISGATDVVSDDYVVLYNQYSTQWDSLGHGGSLFDSENSGKRQIVYYNGYRGGEDIVVRGNGREGFTCTAGPLGIDHMAVRGIQGRGVLLDLLKHFGPTARKISFSDIQHVLVSDGISIRPGDIVCLHTGYAQAIVDMAGRPDLAALRAKAIELDGRDPDTLAWLAESKVAALAADNYAVEALSATPGQQPCASAPLHEHCLFKLGMPLGELWHLGELAAWLKKNERHSFFLTAPPLRLPGAAGSPVTPLATV